MTSPELPGVRYRTETRQRTVPHTINGVTLMVEEDYEVRVPIPPRDWDHIVLTAVTALAGLMLAVAVIWSTASIGDLLDRAVPPFAAYGAAVAFDLAWIMCMAIEWLARYDTQRAALPRKAGHVALLIAMAAVAAHGWLEGADGALIVGIVGASVSGLAKAVWTIVLRHHAKPLSVLTQKWVDQARAEAGGRLAMVAVDRELQRAEGSAAAEALALGRPAGLQRQLDAANETVFNVVRTSIERQTTPKPRRPQPPSEPAGTPGELVDDIAALLGGAHAPVVYFIRNGSRVKIGTSQNLKRRLAALTLRPADVLRAVHGDQRTERELHQKYADQRAGNTEWFDLTGQLANDLGIALDSSAPASSASRDASEDAADTPDDAAAASPDTPQANAPTVFPGSASKKALVLAASSALQPGASAADIAHRLAQQGCAVDTAYVRTVLSREAKKGGVGEGGEGYN
ncbi:hypothetical protein CU044_3747 [Streptomyces sp. L-9-10]|uniref:GIY-YIG nuclease family protein n=1 Tax=Streptomyces sp. L-9-10 TaxID=1478131 RepID=UPI00101D7D82|nr:GIY-YIG nuclease family protein [Streptomyces sp. L-9-10]RYJ26454.1 hypothetical protein CU044_3747 [Streptomyces sp. L-9-10]